MAKSESRLLSGRIKTKPVSKLDSRRSAFISLDNAEPNLGAPDSDRYVLASLTDGTRLFLKFNAGFVVSADSVSADASTFTIDPTGLANAAGTTLADVLDNLDSAISNITSAITTDANFEGDGLAGSPLKLDSDLRIFGITGDSATFTNITSSGTVDFSGATVSDGGTVTTVDIDGGTINNVTIDSSDITVGIGKTLDVSAGTLTLASDQISGDKVEGGTIDTITVNNLTSGNVNVDGGFIDGTAIGHYNADSATFTNLARTSPAGVTAGTYGSTTQIPVITVDSSGFIDSVGVSGITVSTTLNTAADGPTTGSVNLADSSLELAGGEGITTAASGRTITIAGELATVTNKGVASFDSDDFSVTSGFVEIKTGGVSNDQLAGGITTDKLQDATITLGDTTITLGDSSSNLTIDSADITKLDVSGTATLASASVTDLTDNRIVIAGASGELEDDANLTFNGTELNVGASNFTVQQSTGNTQIVGTLDVDGQTTLASANVEDLTNDRLVVAGTDGELEDDANLTYDGSTLTVNNSTASTDTTTGALVVTGGVGIGGALNVGGNMEILGDFTVQGTTTTVNASTLSIRDPLIHLADSNESSDEVDIGFIGHYYDAALGGRQHTGIFRDATDDKYYVFAQYQDSALDSSPRSNIIDRSDPSFVLADFNAATIFADTFSGTVSADSISATGNITAPRFIGDLEGAVEFIAKNASGSTLNKGEVVYINGISGNIPTVDRADADNAAAMPAFGVVKENANNNAEVIVYTFGTLGNLNIPSGTYSVGDTLYVSTTPGAFTNVKPTGESSLIQNIGQVSRVHSSAGSIKIVGAGRTAATPNLNENRIFIGNASNQAVTISLDSAVDSDHVQSKINQEFIDTFDTHDSAAVVGQINDTVTLNYINAFTGGDFDSDLIPPLAAVDITSGIFDSARIPSLAAADITSGIFDSARIPQLSTDGVNEGSNLYYTTSRVDSAIDDKVTLGYINSLIDSSFDSDLIPPLSTVDITSGIFDSARIPPLAADDITSGVLDSARIPQLSTDDVNEGSNLYYTTARVDSAIDDKVTLGYINSLIDSSFDSDLIPPLSASDITSGVFDSDRIPALTADNISGVLDSSVIPALAAADITSGIFDSARIPQLTTDDVNEASNLYYTTARVDSAIDVRVDSDFIQPLARAAIVEGTGITYDSANGIVSTNDAEIDHDALSNFVANEHIDHSTVDIDAGDGLAGGGDITASRTLAVGAGVGIRVNPDDIDIDSSELATYYSKAINHDNTSGFVANEHINHANVNINAGKGLTGGGDITTSRTIDIDSANVRSMFSGGDGLTYDSGTGAFTVVGGDGITANSNEIEVTVDGSTIELSAVDGSGAVRVKDGGITNAKLEFDSSTIGTTSIVLGGSTTTLAGLTQIDVDNVRILDNTVGTSSGDLILDPAPLNDSTGTVVILGDLQVNGTTTTINSVDLTIRDKNIIIADSATSSSQADGAGITVGSYSDNPKITYRTAGDKWEFSKTIDVTGEALVSTLTPSTDSALASKFYVDNSVSASTLQVVTDRGNSTTNTITVAGITTNGDITFSDSDDLIMPDRSKIKLGGDEGLEIYHDSAAFASNFISQKNIRMGTAGSFQVFNAANNQQSMYVNPGGSTILRFANSDRLTTSSSSVDINGNLKISDEAIVSTLTPSIDSALTSKSYVDAQIAALTLHDSALVEQQIDSAEAAYTLDLLRLKVIRLLIISQLAQLLQTELCKLLTLHLEV